MKKHILSLAAAVMAFAAPSAWAVSYSIDSTVAFDSGLYTYNYTVTETDSSLAGGDYFALVLYVNPTSWIAGDGLPYDRVPDPQIWSIGPDIGTGTYSFGLDGTWEFGIYFLNGRESTDNTYNISVTTPYAPKPGRAAILNNQFGQLDFFGITMPDHPYVYLPGQEPANTPDGLPAGVAALTLAGLMGAHRMLRR